LLRTNTCGELRKGNVGNKVTLAGWVHSIRTHGSLTFIDLKDRYGITQITLSENILVPKESVLQVSGEVVAKPEPNKNLETGEIEVKADKYKVLNKAKPLPLDLGNKDTTEETRLKYRYLDLRTANMQKNLVLRHKAVLAAREYLDELSFVELETPVLGKSTPEGARDYLVPSRVNKGKFYALPQSPQIYKQLFQVAGFDRYMQMAKCFRDEDLRADRQPEFTQIDLELSFVEEEDIYQIMEGLIKHVWKKTIDEDLKTPFKRMTHDEAMSKYGSDKPDLRFGLELIEVTVWAKLQEFKIFQDAESVNCLKVSGNFSRKQIDEFTEAVKVYGAKGLAWLKKSDVLEGSIAKFVKDAPVNLEKDEYLFFVADKKQVVQTSLGQLRLKLGKMLNLVKDEWNFCWVTDFPLLEWSEEDKRFYAMHHPFTSPRVEDVDLLLSNPQDAKARAYDLTLNGTELGGGSIRIHERDLQKKVFQALNIDEKEQEEKFGFLLSAFEFGAPPHGGIAFGLDRVVMLLVGAENIREVMAFPKNKDGYDLMMNAPSLVTSFQLDELHIELKK
jgi:aspartyl-tRNA synthetase